MKLYLLLISASICSANMQTLQVPYARDMSAIVPVSKTNLSVSLPILNNYPHGYAIEKNLRVKLGCDGKNLVCEYKIPYRKGYKSRPTKKHDGPLWHEDSVEIFLKRSDAKRAYCQYIINPAGTVFDRNSSKGVIWNSKLKVESNLKNNIWHLKVLVPLSDINLNKITKDTDIGFNTAVRSVDGENKYILGLFPFFPNRFAQPDNFAELTLSPKKVFVSKFQRKYELKNGVARVILKLNLTNSSSFDRKITVNDNQYSITKNSTITIAIPQTFIGLRKIIEVKNIAGLNYAINMSNPFVPKLIFMRSGKNQILIKCTNLKRLSSEYDKIKIKFEGLKPVAFRPLNLDGAMFARLSCVGLKPGNRTVTIESIKNGRVINRVVTKVLVIDETPIDFDLSKFDASKYYKPMKVALPVIQAARSKIRFAPDSVFPESIKVDDTGILSGPAYFTINKRSKQNDKKITVTNQNKNRISLESSFNIGKTKVCQKAFADYDGLVWLDNKMEFKSKGRLQKISATIPVKLKGDIFLNYSRLIHNWQLTPERFKTEGTFNKSYLAWSKKLEDGKSVILPLTSMISLVNDFRGLVIYPPVNPARLNILNYDKYIAISRKGENVDVTITLSDGQAALADKNLNFTLGLQPIPSRIYNTRANFDFRVYKGSRSGHDLIYSQGKINATINTGTTWIIPFQCWTEYQNYYTTYKYAEVMHKVITMLHNKRKSVSPYFGFEISDVCPEAKLYLRTVSSGQSGGYIRENYAQQCWSVCYASQWGDYWLKGIKKFLPEYKIDGMYMDGTLGVHSCTNELHCHGMRDSRSRCVPYFPLLEIRRFSQILHQITRSYKSDFMLYLHNSHPFVPATMGFVDVILNGEQTKPILGTWRIPLDVYRAEFNGRQIGVPIQILSYAARKTYRREYAGSLLFDQIVTPWTISRAPEVLFTETVWKIFDKYKLNGKYFVPFYSPDAKIKDKTGKMLISYYDTPNYLAIVVSNYGGTDKSEADIDLQHFAGKIKTTGLEVLNKKEIPVENNSINISIGKENFKFIVIDKM